MTDADLSDYGLLWATISDQPRLYTDGPARAGSVMLSRREAVEIAEGRKAAAKPPHQQPAPRPTCATCPHWCYERSRIPSGEEFLAGFCQLDPSTTRNCETSEDWSCSYHPEMPKWIAEEFPKELARRAK